MMPRYWIVVLLAGVVSFPVFGQKTPPAGQNKKPLEAVATLAAANTRLPVKRVVLYKNGVGYFEHSARVHGTQDLTIDFTTAQLNDVLKSLTAMDLGEGRVSSIRYNSIAPLDERLKALRLPFVEQVTQADFLSALRGSRVEARSGPITASGRLLSVETEQRTTEKGASYNVTKFSVIADSGEVRNFELGPGTSVRLAERDLTDEVGKYLSLIGSSRAADLRRMTIAATGTGDRDIFVSYISEVPVWKSTYRIILPEKPTDKPLLQGWAIVDNTVGEDWKDVQLSLIAGAPQSFIENISQPYYTRRPVVQPPPSVMLTPQAHEGTMTTDVINGRVAPPPPPPSSTPGLGVGVGGTQKDSDRLEQFARLQAPPALRMPGGGLAGTVVDPSGANLAGAQVTLRDQQTGASQGTTTDSRGTYQFYGLPAGTYALTISMAGFNKFAMRNVRIVTGHIEAINATLAVATVSETVEVEAESAEVSEAAGRQHVEAESKDLGDYFEYNIKQPITIGKNQSALVPILQARVEAEKVSLWSEESKEIRRALWLTNSSSLTLDSGTFNILDGATFAGEGLIETVHPSERRLISYAGDPAVRITMEEESSAKPATRVRISKGIMVLTRENRDSRHYTVHNADTQPRQVVIEHPAREGWKLAEGARAEETSASYLRFRVAVGPGQTEKLNLEEYQPQDVQVELSDLDDEKTALLIKENQMTPAVLDVLRRVQAQQNQVASFETQISARRNEVSTIEKDQARVRENMKALKGSAEEKALLQRYTRQLDSQEDRLNILQKEIDDLQAKHDKAEQELDEMVQQISLDEKL